MSRQPPQFDAIQCKHCHAIVALLPPGALVADTRVRCVRCSVVVLIIKPIETKIKTCYNEHTALESPA